MKNSTRIREWLDACAEMLDSLTSDDPDVVALGPELNDHATRLWRACQNNGWTIGELDEIYGRHFNVDVAALRRS